MKSRLDGKVFLRDIAIICLVAKGVGVAGLEIALRPCIDVANPLPA